ncbi:hypothetical protein [Reichenbachiella ulvae]|uniref:Uncharacterized protein n=1 Tax=Reichenbachiella ulvae TaxID=2980104 RepID=A0ABT3CPD8_9BACT|nr:hypothetical protein [Reichenbachiella ulvae]MCV9385551.1 hypothetical protein [Reichenbachiella ulvae]
MKTTFLDYYKLILDRVSFNEELFQKEYRKAMKVLEPEDREALKNWAAKRILERVSERISA